ncbi:MAG: diaminopimelate decarboxylase, partial [Planctomycetota bacterium]
AYAPADRDPDMAQWGRQLTASWSAFQSRIRDPQKRGRLSLHLQPGRYLVADSGYLLMTVQSIKSTPSMWFAGTDSGLNHNIRHPLYRSYHPIFNATGMTRGTRFTAVCGNICESGDLFSHGRDIPQPRVGDILALGMAGAYGMSMASHYNSQPLPAEVMVQNGVPILIRRRECYDDLTATQENLS